MEEAGCCELTLKRAKDGERPGALWHIFDAQDADKIRDLLNKVRHCFLHKLDKLKAIQNISRLILVPSQAGDKNALDKNCINLASNLKD